MITLGIIGFRLDTKANLQNEGVSFMTLDFDIDDNVNLFIIYFADNKRKRDIPFQGMSIVIN